MGLYGVRDIAGNVREWCLNRTGESHYILGGGWSDPEYAFTDAYAQPPFNRAPINGIRLVEYSTPDSAVAVASKPVERAFRDFSKETPIPNHIFTVFRRYFEYDRTPLNPEVQLLDTTEDWTRQRIEIDAAYGGERLPAYLFLPRKGRPPYQTIIYFPGSNSIHTRTAEGSLETRNFDYIVKSGRAVMYPVYKSTYERGDGLASDYANQSSSYREHVVMWVKDLRRAIDYLETRPEIASRKLGYFGFSWGGYLGGLVPAVEPRLRVSVLLVAGLQFPRGQPEVEPVNYLPRIKIPVLMLNGQYDFFFPVQTSQVPMFRLLGTPVQHKRQVISEGGHFVPRAQQISETLAWLDRYLGPAR
jgi:dienelactone hydrolase